MKRRYLVWIYTKDAFNNISFYQRDATCFIWDNKKMIIGRLLIDFCDTELNKNKHEVVTNVQVY